MRSTGGRPARWIVCVVVLVVPSRAHSQEPAAADLAPARSVVPAPPVAPGVITRDEDGRVTVRATRLPEPLTLDGRLDERMYTAVRPFGEFIQQEPHEGEPATDPTEVWVFFDDDNVYVSLRLTYSQPDLIVANEMRRDALTVWSTNARLRWEYRPGSDLFVVYSDERNTLAYAAPDLLNHSVAIKFTRLLRY